MRASSGARALATASMIACIRRHPALTDAGRGEPFFALGRFAVVLARRTGGNFLVRLRYVGSGLDLHGNRTGQRKGEAVPGFAGDLDDAATCAERQAVRNG